MGVYDIKQPSRLNAINILLAAAIISAAYVGWWYLPQWWPAFQVTAIMNGVANDAYREFDDKKLLVKLVAESKRTGLPLSEENFELIREPWPVDQKGGNNSAILDRRGRWIVVRFEYTSFSKWPLTEKPTELHFTKEIRGDLKTIAY